MFTTGTAILPFSQYIDLGDCGEEDELQLTSCLTGADVEPTIEGSGVNVTLQLLTMAKVWSRRELRYLADAYSLNGALTPETEEKELSVPAGPAVLLAHRAREYHRRHAAGDLLHLSSG